MSQWFYASNGGQMGPVDTAELKRLAGAGTVQPTSLVWRDGLSEWVQASKIKGLFGPAEPAGTSGVAEAGGPDTTVTEATTAAAEPYYDPAATPGYPAASRVISYQGGGVPVGVSARSMDFLRQTRPWVLFLSVLGFIVTGIMVLFGVGFGLLGMAGGGRGGVAMGAGMGLLYIAISAIYFFPALFLWRYGSRIGGLMAGGQLQDLENALEAQKSFWRFTGILMAVVIVLYVVVIAGAVVVAALG